MRSYSPQIEVGGLLPVAGGRTLTLIRRLPGCFFDRFEDRAGAGEYDGKFDGGRVLVTGDDYVVGDGGATEFVDELGNRRTGFRPIGEDGDDSEFGELVFESICSEGNCLV